MTTYDPNTGQTKVCERLEVLVEAAKKRGDVLEHILLSGPPGLGKTTFATVLPNGFAQVTPRGSTMVFDDEHLALWERGRGTTNENLKDGTKVTVFFRKPQLREMGILPKGGIRTAIIRR